MDMTPHAKGMVGMKKSAKTVSIVMGNKQVENSVAIGDIPGVVEKLQFSLFLISCSQGILNASLLSWILSPKESLFTCIFHSYENFYKLTKMHCLLVLTFHFPIIRKSECRNPTIQHIFTYTLISPFISTYEMDLFLGSISHSKIPF